MAELRKHILAKAHNSRYSIHRGATKMYRNLRKVYWWNDMKRDIADFVSKCPNCQQVKVEHQKPGGMTQEIDIPTWKWDVINMDFITGLPRTRRQHDSIWVIDDKMLSLLSFWRSRLHIWQSTIPSFSLLNCEVAWGSFVYHLR